MWTAARARLVIRDIEAELSPAGWHVALAGSVLTRGYSEHDLDLIVYPHCKPRKNIVGLRAALARYGLTPYASRTKVTKGWRLGGSLDTKWVEVWMLGARRVDVIVLS